MNPITAVSTVVSAAAAVVQAVSQAKTVFWGSHLSKLVLTDNAEDNARIINDAFAVLLSHVKDSNKMESSETCKEWISQVKDVVAEYDKISKESSFWSPSSLDSREQRRKMFDKIKKLLHKKYEMMVDPSPERVVKSSRAPDISRFRTLQEPLEQTLVLLEHDKIKRICIYGAVGIGKTTILRHLNNHEQVAKKFDIVIWLKVSKEESEENLSREHLQQDIVQRLKLNIGDTSNAHEVAIKISMELEHKRYLLLLDDVKDYLDLSEIGIPESNNRSKIVLTTRLLNDCYEMVDRPILVERLSEVDAWRMFQDVLDEPKLIENRKTMQVAKKLCKGCGRLPLVIEKVAKIFKWKAKDDLWVDGLNSWRGLAARECQGIRELYELLKQFCYDSLDDDQCKNCFLYCALYPEDTDINKNDLLECWEANNLLFNGNSTTNGNSILDYLQKLSILEEGKSMDHVKMDKFIRQVAVYVTEVYPEHRHLVKASKALKQPPDVKLWGEMNRISLGDNELKQLPDSPNCPMLSTLFLQKNLCLEKIDPSFFKNMKKLGVLDLSHTGLRLLPSSISSLDSLKILYLVGCKGLSNLPSDIDGLKQLETLDIRENGFNNIPLQIEKLSCLRRLRVSFTESGNESVHLNYDIISKLPKLEELIIDVNSVEELPNEMVDNIIKEVATLQQFKSLKICLSEKVAVVIEVKSSRSLHICSPETAFALYLTKNSSWRDAISAFEFYIGCQNSEVSQSPKFLKYDKYIKYCNGASRSFPFPEALAKADAFELVNHKNIEQLSDFGSASMDMVQGCLIESCDAIKTIVGGSAVLPNVEHLFLKNLPQLESIWKGPGLTKLMTLDLISCQMLVKIFPAGVIQQLHEIQYLKIDKCQEIEEIIAESDAVGNLKVLPKLKQLILLDMPKLRSVCAIESLEWGSLEKIEILKCPILLKLPFNKDNAAKLETIEAEQEWWEKLHWQKDEVKERLQKLCTLRDAKERLVTEGGGNTSSGLVIEEITEEHSVSSENCESSAKEYMVSQPQETSCCSKSQPEINIEAPSTNSECVYSLKDDPEAIRTMNPITAVSTVVSAAAAVVQAASRAKKVFGGSHSRELVLTDNEEDHSSELVLTANELDNPRIINEDPLEQTLVYLIEEWNDAKELYLMDNKLSKLPENPKCPILTKLWLHKNYDLMEIPRLFFEDMPLLHLLDLSYTSIKSLPPSISTLVLLHTFRLKGCELLMELPPQIGELGKLEEFDLEGTELMYLPKEIGQLISLKCFRVSFGGCANRYEEFKQMDSIIPTKVLSKLSELNELSIDVNPDDDQRDVDVWDANVKEILNELSSLQKLKILRLYLPSVESLQQLRWNNKQVMYPDLSPFGFTVGHHSWRIIFRLPHEVGELFKKWEKSEKCLKYINGEGKPGGITEALQHASVFFLDRHYTAKTLSEFGNENMVQLKFCLLVECNELQTIIDGDGEYRWGVDNKPVFGWLQYLGIHYMKNLQSICKGQIDKGCLSNLRYLALHTCPNLITIFTPNLLCNLVNLEELIVEDCFKVKGIVSQESSDFKSSGYVLQNLKKMSLLHLPELVTISGGLSFGPVLESLIVYNCPKLKILHAMEVSSDNLKINGEKEWWDALKWHELEWRNKTRPSYNEFESDEDSMGPLAKEIYSH